jgi:hypothetical protein
MKNAALLILAIYYLIYTEAHSFEYIDTKHVIAKSVQIIKVQFVSETTGENMSQVLIRNLTEKRYDDMMFQVNFSAILLALMLFKSLQANKFEIYKACSVLLSFTF